MLRDLAHQLGTTLEYLWPRYTQYVAAQAVADAVVFGLVCTLLCITSLLHVKLAVKKSDDDDISGYGWFVGVISGVGTLITGVIFLLALGKGIAAGMAPEGYALTKLLAQLK